MSYPVFMAGTDVSGLQPSCSLIITATQAGGLGYLILRRWRSITCHPLAREIGQCPSARAFPLSRPSASIRGSPPLRQRRYAMQPGVVRIPALPRVQARSRPLPQAGLCRRPTRGGSSQKASGSDSPMLENGQRLATPANYGAYFSRRNPAEFVTVRSVVFVDSVGTTTLPIAVHPTPMPGVPSKR